MSMSKGGYDNKPNVEEFTQVLNIMLPDFSKNSGGIKNVYTSEIPKQFKDFFWYFGVYYKGFTPVDVKLDREHYI
jgi:hypothetical protein